LGFIIADVKNIPQTAIDTYNNLVAPIAAQYQGYNNGWFVLPIVAGATSWLSSVVMQPAQQQQQQNNQQAGAGMTKAMKYVIPAMSVFFCLTANAAFAVYWTISNVVSIVVNVILNKTVFKPKEANSTEVQ
ncbi:MAG: YidC/Oxa1 family membrane protein insertase, partial [Eubacteriales bacterium]|nr:YidC/Oxa1 family membrane protein insertase [Eubacteriales bacterium]